jgi:hypothetical protein
MTTSAFIHLPYTPSTTFVPTLIMPSYLLIKYCRQFANFIFLSNLHSIQVIDWHVILWPHHDPNSDPDPDNDRFKKWCLFTIFCKWILSGRILRDPVVSDRELLEAPFRCAEFREAVLRSKICRHSA